MFWELLIVAPSEFTPVKVKLKLAAVSVESVVPLTIRPVGSAVKVTFVSSTVQTGMLPVCKSPPVGTVEAVTWNGWPGTTVKFVAMVLPPVVFLNVKPSAGSMLASFSTA